MAVEQLVNNPGLLSGTLATNINNSVNSITVTGANASPFPQTGPGQYRIIIDSELMLVTGGQGTTTLTVTRGDGNSVPASHSAGAPVYPLLTVESLLALFVGKVPFFQPAGLTGAVAGARFVGGTVSGPPVSGSFFAGDFIIDQSGSVWICTVSGTQGTWINAQQKQVAARVDNSQGTTSTSYTDLASTFGPQISLLTGSQALIKLSAIMGCQSQFSIAYMSFHVTGATTMAASDANCIRFKEPDTDVNTEGETASGDILVQGLNPGVNIFTAHYRSNSGVQANFALRTMVGVAL